MRIWFDTEFIEDGRTIDLISIGMVREDGQTYYAESKEADLSKASPWVAENVIPRLSGNAIPRWQIASNLVEFAGLKPEFWAYFGAYDWVALCQLFGTMMQLPKLQDWPMMCLDIKQLCVSVGDPQLPKQVNEHNALSDAMWTKEAWEFLMARSR
jgi:hypothetical protein